MLYYTRHIFFCTNKKSKGGGCGTLLGEEAFTFAKTYLQSLDNWGQGKLRASKSGCLGRCDDGPTCVIYPDGVWYSYDNEADVKEILDKHLISGQVVTRLLLTT